MTMIKHHLTPELLMGYAAGTLPEAFNLVVATHLSMCDQCRADAEAYDNLGGCVLDQVSVGGDCQVSLDATLARITGGPAPVKNVVRRGSIPSPLMDYIGGDLDAVRWRPVGLGVRQAILPTSKGARARLLHIPAGSEVPDHGHRGIELTLVLKGAFSDQTDHFRAGDVEVATEDLQHTPVADPGEDCICLAATDAPLRFTSFLPRMAQPFLKI